MANISCKHHPKCSGCHDLITPYSQQIQNKVAQLRNNCLNIIQNDTQISSSAFESAELRNRIDLVYSKGILGIYNSHTKELIDILDCKQISPSLQEFLTDFRLLISGLNLSNKGSLRLRVSPNGQRGVWLDFSNIDIKYLLEDESFLRKLLEQEIVIEVGQKKKTVTLRDNKLKLGEPKTHAWTETYLAHDNFKPIGLQAHISSFSQPGLISNKEIIKTMANFLADTSSRNRAIEFGSGSGNLTLALANLGYRVTACELDQAATEGLSETLKALSKSDSDLAGSVEIKVGNFHKPNDIDFSQFDLIVLNPPRSGVGDFLKHLPADKKNQSVFYMSCFLDSFKKDSEVLIEKGFHLKRLHLLDQFPYSEHFEILSYWTHHI